MTMNSMGGGGGVGGKFGTKVGSHLEYLLQVLQCLLVGAENPCID